MNPQTFAWLVLAASVVAEVLGTLALRYADGFTKPLPSAAVVVCYACAIWLMSLAVRHLEMGLTYAVWAGACPLTRRNALDWCDRASPSFRSGASHAAAITHAAGIPEASHQAHMLHLLSRADGIVAFMHQHALR